jgi:hypothetical protein
MFYVNLHHLTHSVWPLRACSYKVSVWKSEGKGTPGRTKRGWDANMKMNLRGVDWKGVDCINLAQDRDQWQAVEITVMNSQILSKRWLFLKQLLASKKD